MVAATEAGWHESTRQDGSCWQLAVRRFFLQLWALWLERARGIAWLDGRAGHGHVAGGDFIAWNPNGILLS